jgi:hypothetical protein
MPEPLPQCRPEAARHGSAMAGAEREHTPSAGSLSLGRLAFRDAVFARDKGRCVLCARPGVDAHHIIERKLFEDGGYYLANGATLCAACHLAAERTTVSATAIRQASGIGQVILPAHCNPALEYDKWGNEVCADGSRLAGPLFFDEGCQRALRAGGLLWRFGTP